MLFSHIFGLVGALWFKHKSWRQNEFLWANGNTLGYIESHTTTDIQAAILANGTLNKLRWECAGMCENKSKHK